MVIFTRSKLNFIKLFLMFIVLSTSSISIAQTKEKIDIDSKAKELGITTTELKSILNSALRNGGGGDPLPEALTKIFFTGQSAGDMFGTSVSTAGDVNGDGYSDVIVGAYGNDAVGSNAGSAYIYFGGTSMDTTADVTMTGEAAGDQFGYSVSTAGDVNGDGYSDVIVGAHYYDAGGDTVGRSYIYFGGTLMDTTADVTMTSEAANDHFGVSVSTAGDVNGDGYSDVIVGAYWNDAGGSWGGRSYIYFGGTLMDDTADVIMTGEDVNDFFGSSVSDAGDVNGDGYSDVIVGAPHNDAGGDWAGRSYIYFGDTLMDNSADVIMTGEAAFHCLGESVSTAGDVNGDGYSDVIISAYFNIHGSAYIYFGGTSMDNTADVIMTGDGGWDAFGRSVSTAGDVNGDGYSDVIVDAYTNDAGGDYAGRSYIYFGGIAMDNSADVIMTGEAAYDYFGVSSSSAGDVNGDGYSDVIVGAHGNDVAGSAYIYLNSLTGLDIPDEFFTGEAAGDWFGCSVSTAGDVNGDGYSDVIVGANGYDLSVEERGKSYIYFGGTLLDNSADVKMYGAAAGDWFGYSVSTTSDVNGDGYSDVIVGAPMNDAGGIDAGSAYIYFGGTSMDNSADVTMTGEAAGDYFGRSVSTAGDVNGDGYSDVIVGATGNDAGASNAGRTYIYFGGTSMDNSADVTMTGEAANDLFGRSVFTAGDVNGDGYSDVIVGAYGNDAGASNAGRSYIYYGGTSMDNSADVTMTGEAAGDYFGQSVSTAGDVNGDGYSDVIVGAYENDDGGIDAGKSYIYFGSTSMDNSADVTMTGEAAGDRFGVSVSTAGDVNGDGYSDVIVGADFNDAGSAYIYFGGTSMNNSADVTMTGEAAGDTFGYSVSTAGDVNGDGLGDVIVGADLNDAGGIDAGKAYLYLSSSPPVVLSANVKMYLEGPYLTGSMSIELNTFGFIPLNQPFNTTPWNYAGTESVGSIPASVVDWVLVELRSDITTMVSRRAGFLKSDGSIVDLNGVSLLNFPSVSNGNYYVIVYQRNHIPIMTAGLIALSEASTLYDFTTAQTQAYGTNAMVDLGGGACGMCSGDASKDGQIDADDRAATWNERNEVGYKDEDVSMDGQVDADDRATTWNNRNIVSQVPAAVTAMSGKNKNQNNFNK